MAQTAFGTPPVSTKQVTKNLSLAWGLAVVGLLIVVGVAVAIVAHNSRESSQKSSPEASLTLPNEGVSPNTEKNAEIHRNK
jgi:hypothetical protein